MNLYKISISLILFPCLYVQARLKQFDSSKNFFSHINKYTYNVVFLYNKNRYKELPAEEKKKYKKEVSEIQDILAFCARENDFRKFLEKDLSFSSFALQKNSFEELKETYKFPFSEAILFFKHGDLNKKYKESILSCFDDNNNNVITKGTILNVMHTIWGNELEEKIEDKKEEQEERRAEEREDRRVALSRYYSYYDNPFLYAPWGRYHCHHAYPYRGIYPSLGFGFTTVC